MKQPQITNEPTTQCVLERQELRKQRMIGRLERLTRTHAPLVEGLLSTPETAQCIHAPVQQIHWPTFQKLFCVAHWCARQIGRLQGLFSKQHSV